MVLTFCFFFVYGSYFDVWGKIFSGMSPLILYGFYAVILIMVIETIIMGRIALKYKQQYGTHELSSKTILIIMMGGLLLLAVIQLSFLPWKVDFKNSKALSGTISLGEHPLWNPPHIWKVNGMKIKVYSTIDIQKAVINSTNRFIIILVVGMIAYFQALKREMK